LIPKLCRLWLIQAALWQRRRKRSAHRRWRPGRAHFGEFVQMDGWLHYCFEDRGADSCLMNMVDGATSASLSLMAEEETAKAARTLLWKWIETFAIPAAHHTDHKKVYIIDEEIA
jgi:hypothetical protein